MHSVVSMYLQVLGTPVGGWQLLQNGTVLFSSFHITGNRDDQGCQIKSVSIRFGSDGAQTIY
jgi:hypothetical protein